MLVSLSPVTDGLRGEEMDPECSQYQQWCLECERMSPCEGCGMLWRGRGWQKEEGVRGWVLVVVIHPTATTVKDPPAPSYQDAPLLLPPDLFTLGAPV
ncbi:unnamed protein product [Lota lota]